MKKLILVLALGLFALSLGPAVHAEGITIDRETLIRTEWAKVSHDTGIGYHVHHKLVNDNQVRVFDLTPLEAVDAANQICAAIGANDGSAQRANLSVIRRLDWIRTTQIQGHGLYFHVKLVNPDQNVEFVMTYDQTLQRAVPICAAID